MSVATKPASRMPMRNSAGSRKRSDLKNTAALGRVVARSRAGLVADPPHRHDRRSVAELPPQLAHVDVDRPRIAREGVAPHALEQLVAREHEAAVVEQLPEEVELLRCQADLLVPDVALAAAGIEDEVAVLEDAGPSPRLLPVAA